MPQKCKHFREVVSPLEISQNLLKSYLANTLSENPQANINLVIIPQDGTISLGPMAQILRIFGDPL